MPQRVRVIVEFDLPPGANTSDALAYVYDAVLTETGLLNPENPLSNLNRESVKAIDAQLIRGKLKPSR